MRFLHILIIIILATIFINNEPPPQHQLEYQNRGNRYEGIKEIGISAPDLELMSFTGYREETPANYDVSLKIKFYMPSDNTLYITAKELRLQKFYLMKPMKVEWRKGWQIFWPWPTKDVINPLGIKVDQIGVVGRMNSDQIGSGCIAPLVIFHNKTISKIDQYDIYLRPKETLSLVDYKLYKANGNKLVLSDKITDNLFSMEPFPIHLNLIDKEKGEYKLVIKCQIKNRIGGPSRTYTFYHNPFVN